MLTDDLEQADLERALTRRHCRVVLGEDRPQNGRGTGGAGEGEVRYRWPASLRFLIFDFMKSRLR